VSGQSSNGYDTGAPRPTAEDLHRAQCIRDGIRPARWKHLGEAEQAKYRDQAVSGRSVTLMGWHGDHRDLVSVLWDHGIQGQDADRLASAIMRSGYADARRAHEQIEMLDRVEAVVANGATYPEAIAILRHLMIHAEPIGSAPAQDGAER
jgi:hypothetical protein